ncbi:uncharacterized protein [Arachis hypogaea]|uniref:uncharacterized protein isoform X2 n=1 Tax=Arachis hypogaea TaxID=3818 RepID=UPI003B226CEF
MAEPRRNNQDSSNNQESTIPNIDLQSIAQFMNHIASLQAHLNRGSTNSALDLHPSNPFYLHPSENPGIPISTVILNGKNYNTWSRSMLLALKSKNKLGFIDGTIAKPEENDNLFGLWDRCNTYIVAWINLSLEPSISHSVIWNNIASDMWSDLRHRYYQGDRFRVAELQEELHALRQGDLDVTTYFTNLRSIWEELENFRGIPSCSCGSNCVCGLGVIKSHRAEDQVTRFLRGLNDQYSGVRSQVMLMEPLPSINVVFSLLTQQERQAHSLGPTSHIMAHFAIPSNTAEAQYGRGRGRGRGGRSQATGRGQGGRSRVQCAHCGKTGHTVDVCYKKHGFPPHLRNKFGGEAAVNSLAAVESERINEDLSTKLDGSGIVESGFTAEQRQALLALLGNHEVRPIHSTNQIVAQSQPLPLQGLQLYEDD